MRSRTPWSALFTSVTNFFVRIPSEQSYRLPVVSPIAVASAELRRPAGTRAALHPWALHSERSDEWRSTQDPRQAPTHARAHARIAGFVRRTRRSLPVLKSSPPLVPCDLLVLRETGSGKPGKEGTPFWYQISVERAVKFRYLSQVQFNVFRD